MFTSFLCEFLSYDLLLAMVFSQAMDVSEDAMQDVRTTWTDDGPGDPACLGTGGPLGPGVTWHGHGKPMENPWKTHGKPMETHGKWWFNGIYWCFNGGFMGMLPSNDCYIAV